MKYVVLIALALAGCASPPTNPLHVGDIAIAQNWNHRDLNGQLVTVTGEWKWRQVREIGGALQCYEVTTPDGQVFAAQSFQLRRSHVVP